MPDMKMVDMAMTKAEMKAEHKGMCGVGPAGDANPYPWGLAITVEGRELDKLGMKDMPDVGTECYFTVCAKVTSVNQSAHEGGKSERRVGMQITGMQLVEMEAAGADKGESKAAERKEARSVASKYRS
jgi:hypothetical protein